MADPMTIRYLILERHKSITKCAGNAIQNGLLFLGAIIKFAVPSDISNSSALLGV